jgi:hypothetical protein
MGYPLYIRHEQWDGMMDVVREMLRAHHEADSYYDMNEKAMVNSWAPKLDRLLAWDFFEEESDRDMEHGSTEHENSDEQADVNMVFGEFVM